MRNRQERITLLCQVSFFIVMEARREMQKGDGCGRPLSQADLLLSIRRCSRLCKHFYGEIVAIEKPLKLKQSWKRIKTTHLSLNSEVEPLGFGIL